MKPISIIAAYYLDGYKIKIEFNDHKSSIVDFAAFLNTHNHPQYNEYKNKKKFKQYRIENGNLVWGKDWDLIFPIWNLYNGFANNQIELKEKL